MIPKEKKEEKKAVGIAELAAIVSVMVSILVAATTLLSGRGYVPTWWFDFSLIFLILLMFSVPILIFWKPIYHRAQTWRLGRNRDLIAQRYFAELEVFVDKLRIAVYPISELWSMIKQHYQSHHQKELGMLPLLVVERTQTHLNQIQNKFHKLASHFKGFTGSMRDFSLLVDELNEFLEDMERQVQIVSVYANEMKLPETNPQILKKFEEFREQYNLFVNDYKNYCQRINREFGEYTFPEHFEYVKKW